MTTAAPVTTATPDEPAFPAPGDGGLVRLRLELAYDGGQFSGWAVQPGLRTVQGVLEAALARVLRRPVRLTAAGRTDAGVHALAQVAHADVPEAVWFAERDRLSRRLAGVLPTDVRVTRIEEVPAQFDARASALWRRYAYRVSDVAWGVAPLRRTDTAAWPRPLSDAVMIEATAALLGEHDFAAFCRPRPTATTVRTLQRWDWERDGEGVLTATLQADAFCHHMVRGLVGCLLAVGEGRHGVGFPATLLVRRERSGEFTVAPARGLTLLAVGYPEASGYAARSAVTRARRSPPPPVR